jgi:hypothetical protein
MRRQLRILLGLSACFFSLELCGCRSNPASAVHATRPSTASAERIRTDGIYECRGVDVRVSTGGWPFLHLPPTTRHKACFLRFYPHGNGETRFMESSEPITTAEAVRQIDGMGGVDSANGKTYLPESHSVEIVFGRPFPVYVDGVIGDQGQLILRWTPWGAGPEGPQESYVFRFIKWP